MGEPPLRLLVATALDGWMELREGRYVSHRMAGQLAATRVRAVEDQAGKLVAHGEGGSFVLASDGWHPEAVSSPVALPEVVRRKEQPQRAVHAGPNGKSFAVFRDMPEDSSDDQPHLLVTAECTAERCRAIGQETTTLTPDSTFLTPDAALWAIDRRGLWSFRKGHWSVALEGSGTRTGLGFGVRVVPTKRQPWFLDGRDGAKLFWPGDGQAAPHLSEVTGIGITGPDAEDHDVVECGGRIYVANADKVCLVNDKGRCAPLAIKGAQWPRRLGCDWRNQLWLGGYGLSRVEGGVAVPVHDLDGFIGGREVLALGRDGGAGLAVVIEGRGIAVLDPAQPTPPTPARALDEETAPQRSRSSGRVHGDRISGTRGRCSGETRRHPAQRGGRRVCRRSGDGLPAPVFLRVLRPRRPAGGGGIRPRIEKKVGLRSLFDATARPGRRRRASRSGRPRSRAQMRDRCLRRKVQRALAAPRHPTIRSVAPSSTQSAQGQAHATPAGRTGESSREDCRHVLVMQADLPRA